MLSNWARHDDAMTVDEAAADVETSGVVVLSVMFTWFETYSDRSWAVSHPQQRGLSE